MKDGPRGLMFFYQEGEPPSFEGTGFWFSDLIHIFLNIVHFQFGFFIGLKVTD